MPVLSLRKDVIRVVKMPSAEPYQSGFVLCLLHGNDKLDAFQSYHRLTLTYANSVLTYHLAVPHD